MPLRKIPLGSTVHCVEMKPGKGAQIARSAGTSLQLVAREGNYATLRLRSGEMRKVLSDCRATLVKCLTQSISCAHSVKRVPSDGEEFGQPFVVLP